jgi:hypothetical protein
MNGISAVLIVKNEEKLLGRCIRSLVGFDEIVVLDTGSTDRTMEIARGLGAKVFTTEPIKPFHFAEARNRALVHASHDWTLSIDADEILRPGSTRKIRTALDQKDAAAFSTTFVNRAENDHSRTVEIRKIKIFRKGSWNWKYRVHELLAPALEGLATVDLPQVVIEHLPDMDKSERHGQNLELLRLCVEESPEYTRAYRHLGQELMLRKEYPEAVRYLAQYVEKTEEGPIEKSQALLWIGKCYGDMGKLDDAVRWFEASYAADPRRREPLYFAGWWLMNKGPSLEHVDRAAKFFEKVLAIPVGSRPQSHLDEPYVWANEPQRLLGKCRRTIAEVVEASRKQQ